MNAVKSLEHFTILLKDFKSLCSRVNTNCYLMKNDISDLIDQNRFFYLYINDGLIFLCDEGFFYQLYYYVKKDIEDIQFNKNGIEKPVIINFVSNAASASSLADANVDLWAASGFSAFEETQRLRLSFSEIDEKTLKSNIEVLENKGFSFKEAAFSEISEITKIWDEALDPRMHVAYFNEALKAEAEKGHIICAYDSAGVIKGALQCEYMKSGCMIWYIAVTPDMRGMRIGEALLTAFFEKAADKGINHCLVWVVSTNHGAQKFYKRIGFKFDGKISKRLILE